jgi:hypothetical protein
MTKDEALDLALEALEELQPDDAYPYSLQSKAITAIKQARSVPVQDIGVEQDERVFARIEARKNRDAAHKETAQRSWIGLTDEEVFETHKQVDSMQYLTFGKAIEAKLREKNGWYRQHVTDGSPCWCEPEISYTDPETGASVVVHKEPQ